MAAVLATGLAMATPAYAIVGGTPVATGNDRFTVKLDIGGTHSCSGALVELRWVITASDCFAQNGTPATAGAPPVATTATIGRADLTGTAGRVLNVVEIAPNPTRNVTLVRLDKRVFDIAPVTVGSTPVASGDQVRLLGYGRTATELVPYHLQSVSSAVTSTGTTTFTVAGTDDATIDTCKGDSGGPTLREGAGGTELVGIHSGSWQRGCLGSSATARPGAVEARVDDLGTWIRGITNPQRPPVVPAPFVGGNITFHMTDVLGSFGETRPVAAFGNKPMIPLAGDWNGDGIDTPGVYDPSTSKFYLTDDPDSGQVQYVVWYGNPGDKPLVGDWNGDGRDEVGVHRGFSFNLRTKPVDAEGGDTTVVYFGDPTDKPLIGDWDGDGIDNIGLYRPGSGEFILRTTANTDAKTSYRSVRFGNANETPLVGDFNGDGKDNIGLHRGNHFILRMTESLADGNELADAGFGDAADTPLVGDWNGDGIATIAVVR